MAGEEGIPVRYHHFGNTMQLPHIVNVQLSRLLSRSFGGCWHKMHHLGQLIHYDENGIMTLACPRQLGNEIHSHRVPRIQRQL